MLAAIGVGSLDELLDRALPAHLRIEHAPRLPAPAGEAAVIEELASLAAMNVVNKSMIGQGYYGTTTPAVIRRNVLEDPGWYTAYTPYQPEISQGRLEALLNFQTMVADLTAMDLANASLLDEATAAAEGMMLSRRVAGGDDSRFFIAADCHPQTIAVTRTRAAPLGIEVVVGDPSDAARLGAFGALLQYPGTTGVVRDLRPIISALHEAGTLAVVATDLLACTLLLPPGEQGADVVVGSSQRFGVPLGYGGPHAAFMAVRDRYRRNLPGRLVGVSRDAEGNDALRLALQTREQHIRREKATSNICTAQVLLAVIAGFYAVYHGPEGLRDIAERVHGLARHMAASVMAAGVDIRHQEFFDTVCFETPRRADEVMAAALAAGVNLRRIDGGAVAASVDETTTDIDVAAVVEAVTGTSSATGDMPVTCGVPDALVRTTTYLEHRVFHSHRSETEMMRYLRRLSDRDIALDRAMIPLGSCTMKLNPAAAMEPVTWAGFADIHPYVPEAQAAGYRRLMTDLERWLAELTGYESISLQPNAGSQGEYAGLLAIRGYHAGRGEQQRNVCLIPASAHGTNPASATMAGMEVVVVETDERGNIDIADLKAKAATHAERLAALMITYPSTHGVFEETVVDVCRMVHDHGGQVYMDGANLNALLGLAAPGALGADIGHLNLHKTFAIPHGGGGPGVGPIGARSHLAPYLPSDPLDGSPGAVAAARWGSAGVLPIAWAYIRMMGCSGLTSATRHAVLAANYVAARLTSHFPVLYTGTGGFVAHE
ncbi:MAG: aminomethyl-transferring glycine dehydrogenase, partial [Acidimicrobiia bacterium]